MSNIVLKNSAIEKALIEGDLSQLSVDDRLAYYNQVCKSVGLNPITQPFSYIKLNGKLVLYALKAASDQLRRLHSVSINITSRESIEGVYVVTAKAKDASGREDESTGAVTTANLKGDALANAFMKAETKAKRRVTLSICGLGMLDETEVDSIEGAQKLRDVGPGGPKQDPPKEPPKEKPVEAKPAGEIKNEAPISMHELGVLYEKAYSAKGISRDRFNEMIFERFGVERGTDLKKWHFEQIIKGLEGKG